MKVIAVIVGLISVACASWISPWTVLETVNESPVPEYGRMLMIAVPRIKNKEHDKIFVFGGMNENLQTQFLQGAAAGTISVLSSPRVLDIVDRTWNNLTSSNGKEPSGRAEACGALVNVNGSRKIYIFGGAQIGFANNKDSFWELDWDTKTWTNMSQAAGESFPSTRLGCAAHSWQDGFLMFGGVGVIGGAFDATNQLWFFNASSLTWTLLNPTGDIPIKRIFTTIYMETGSNKLIINGGETGFPAIGNTWYFEDMYELDLTTMVWRQMTEVTELLLTRLHSANALYEKNGGSGSLIIRHSGDEGNCSSLIIIRQSTAVFDMQAKKWLDGILPIYASGPATKLARMVCFKGKLCYMIGGITNIKCSLEQQEYLPGVWVYDPTNKAQNLAKNFID